MLLGYPLPVSQGILFLFLSRKGERSCVLAMFLAPFPEEGILDYIAHRPIIQVFRVATFSGLVGCPFIAPDSPQLSLILRKSHVLSTAQLTLRNRQYAKVIYRI